MKGLPYNYGLLNKFPKPQKVVLWVCIVVMALINYHSLLKNNGDHHVNFYIWIINCILFLFAWGDLRFKHVNIMTLFRKHIKENGRVILLVSFILFFGFVLRVSYLESAPANVGGDEMSQAVEAWKFAQGDRSDIFSSNEWYFSPNFYFYVTSFLFKTFGKSVWTWRFGSVLFGSTTVLLSYILFSDLFSKRIAAFASILLAFYHIHIHFSRLGAHQITDAFWIILISLVFFEAHKSEKAWLYGMVGVLVGISQNFYFGARIIPVLVIFTLLITGAEKIVSGKLNIVFRSLAIILLGFILGVYPFLARYVAVKEAYLSRFNQTFLVDLNDPLRSINDLYHKGVLKKNLSKTFQTFVILPPTGWYTDSFPLLNEISRYFFGFGILLAVFKIRKLEYQYALISFLAPLVVVGVFMENPPEGQRLVIITPFICLITAFGLDFFQGLLRYFRLHKFSVIFTSYFLSTIILLDLNNYFLVYTPKRLYGGENTLIATEMSKYLEKAPIGMKVYFYGSPRMWFYSFSNLRFVTPQVEGIDIESFENINGFTSDRNIIYITTPENMEVLQDFTNVKEDLIWVASYKTPRTPIERISYYFGDKERSWIKYLPGKQLDGQPGYKPLFYFIDFRGVDSARSKKNR